MAIQGFSDLLFDGTLDFPCTYVPKDGLSFTSKAILTFNGFNFGSDSGKGLPRAARQASAEWRHFKMPVPDFPAPPKYGDTIVDDKGDEWTVQSFSPSRSEVWQIYAKANGRYQGPSKGITRV